jgi:hypothetical protein
MARHPQRHGLSREDWPADSIFSISAMNWFASRSRIAVDVVHYLMAVIYRSNSQVI